MHYLQPDHFLNELGIIEKAQQRSGEDQFTETLSANLHYGYIYTVFPYDHYEREMFSYHGNISSDNIHSTTNLSVRHFTAWHPSGALPNPICRRRIPFYISVKAGEKHVPTTLY